MNNTPALYEAVDSKILEKVGKHPKAFVDIYFPEIYTLCVEILNDNKKSLLVYSTGDYRLYERKV